MTDTPTSPPPSQGREAGAKVMTGASISLIGSMTTHVFAVISVAVLGRLLDPSDFGIVAMALIFTGFSDALANRQFDLAIVRTPDIDASHYNTAFGITLIWGVVAGAILFSCAGIFAGWMGEPALVDVLRVLAVLPVLEGVRNPYFIAYERNLVFVPTVVIHLSSKAAQVIAGIALALIVGNYWALVAGLLALSVTRVVLSWVYGRTVPVPRLVHWRYFLGFGGWLTGTGFLGFLMQKTDTALISGRLGAASVGIYNMGAELSMMATHHLAGPLTRMVYPGLASVADDRARLRKAYYTAQEMTLGFMLPLGVGVALVAPELIQVFVGEKWLAAAPVLQILAPALALSSVTYNVQAILMIDGDTRTMFFRNLIVATVQVPLIFAGLVTFGLIGAVLGRVLAVVLHAYLSLRIAGRGTGMHWSRGISVGARSFAAAAAMSLVVVMLGRWLPPPDGLTEAATTGLIKIAAGACVYVITHAALWLATGRPQGFETRITGFALRIGQRLRLLPA